MAKRVTISGLQVLIDVPGNDVMTEAQDALDIMNKHLSRDAYVAGQIIGVNNISDSDISTEELDEEDDY